MSVIRFVVFALSLSLGTFGYANVLTYIGQDVVSDIPTSPIAFPNATRADQEFQAAVTHSSLETFEGFRLSNATSQAFTDGTISWTNHDFGTIRATQDLLRGFNTTPSGSKYLSLESADTLQSVAMTFTFTSPIDAFGAYFTGAGNTTGGVTISFDDGTLQTLSVATANSTSPGAVKFYGLTDFGRSFSSVTIQVGTVGGISDDVIGVDDVRYRLKDSVTAVPEPGLMFCVGNTGLGFWFWRRRVSAALGS